MNPRVVCCTLRARDCFPQPPGFGADNRSEWVVLAVKQHAWKAIPEALTT